MYSVHLVEIYQVMHSQALYIMYSVHLVEIYQVLHSQALYIMYSVHLVEIYQPGLKFCVQRQVICIKKFAYFV